jgi:hypothetical protein
MGYYNYGEGFTFDDRAEGAEPLESMQELIRRDPKNDDRIFPFLGGEEMLTDPTHMHRRFVIDFNEMTEADARRWPDLMDVLERRVFAERQKCKRERLRRFWWQFGEIRPGLRAATIGRQRLLMHPYTSTHVAFAFIPATTYIASPHYAIALERLAAFGVLQSRCHEVWAWTFGSAREDRLTYTASDCFETFPFPTNWSAHPALEAAAATYYGFRGSLMVRNDEGLTKTYNRFHDPDERDPEIKKLRELHADMDRAVLDAYGWSDIPTDCEFLLDYEIDEEESGTRKKPYRLRWPDEVRDEVLARLLELNAERAREEIRTGAAAAPKRARKSTAKRGPAEAETVGLFS